MGAYWIHQKGANSCSKNKCSTQKGFEPSRGNPNGLAVHRLNHSATASLRSISKKKPLRRPSTSWLCWLICKRKSWIPARRTWTTDLRISAIVFFYSPPLYQLSYRGFLPFLLLFCFCHFCHPSPVVGLMQKQFAQCGARTHDPEIKSLVLYRLS